MDEIRMIEERLRSAAAGEGEEARLLELFGKAREGLSSQTSGGVRSEVEARLDGLLEVVVDRAAAIRNNLRE